MESVIPSALADLRFDERGLIPAIVQDARTGEVLMLAFMNAESLARTIETGQTWFYSRSRQALWHKGATSGNTQSLRWMRLDCDGDALLLGVEQTGSGACHVEGQRSCFFRSFDSVPAASPDSFEVIPQLDRVIAERKRDMPAESYTTELLRAGVGKVAKKVGEEGVEVALAAKNHVLAPSDALAGEVADLLYHLLVLARVTGLDVDAVYRALAERRGKSARR